MSGPLNSELGNRLVNAKSNLSNPPPAPDRPPAHCEASCGQNNSGPLGFSSLLKTVQFLYRILNRPFHPGFHILYRRRKIRMSVIRRALPPRCHTGKVYSAEVLCPDKIVNLRRLNCLRAECSSLRFVCLMLQHSQTCFSTAKYVRTDSSVSCLRRLSTASNCQWGCPAFPAWAPYVLPFHFAHPAHSARKIWGLWRMAGNPK